MGGISKTHAPLSSDDQRDFDFAKKFGLPLHNKQYEYGIF
jgi:hypothetical protein